MVSTPEFVAAHLSGLRALELFDPSMPVDRASLGERRRAGQLQSRDIGQITLVEREGILRWEVGSTTRAPVLSGRRAGPAEAPGRVVLPLTFRELEPSDVWSALEHLDRELSGKPELLVWNRGGLTAETPSVLDGKARVLLFVHGTFSKSQAFIDGIARAPNASAFWQWATQRYDAILFLNHHTLRPTPVANALALAELFEGRNITVHAIGHSRGCLVLRWWLEALDRGKGKRRAVMVGGTLGGTSLAAPRKLRAAVGLFTNILRAMHGVVATGSALVPPLAPLASLLRVLSFATKGLSSTPIIDAGVALVPGLAAMSRVGNNAELLALRGRIRKAPAHYYAVRSNFEPDDVGWKFWRAFRGPNIADPAADAIFQGDNDLVVDTSSMVDLADHGLAIPTGKRVLDFGTNGAVHHLNYFEQKQTLEKVMEWLGTD